MLSKLVFHIYRLPYKTNASSDMLDAISEMIDFRKLHGASEAAHGTFSATEL